MRNIAIALSLIVSLSLLTACTELWGPLDSPMDEKSDSYQGFSTESDPDEIEAVAFPEGEDVFAWIPELVVSEIIDAVAYEWDVAPVADGGADFAAASTWHAETEANRLRPNDGGLGVGTYAYRARARMAADDWGEWTAGAEFTLSDEAVVSGLTPEDGATTSETTPELSWEAVEGAVGYEVQIVSEGTAFPDGAGEATDTASYTPSTALGNNATHEWRVRAKDAAGMHGPWSAAQSVAVAFGAVSGLSPADGATTSDTTPELSWGAVEGAAGYEVRTGSTAAEAQAATPVSVSSISYVHEAELSRGDELHWQVRAKDATGTYGEWSAVRSVAIPEYLFGDPGPAGGIVFYDKGSYSDGWRYLEAAPSDQSSGIEWGGYGTTVGGTSTAIGTGKANTEAIVAKLGAGSYAARICYDLELGGYDDWYLPSKDELNQLYSQRSAVGGFASGYYWSSSEHGSGLAWGQSFSSGRQGDSSKYSSLRVRAVRGF